MKARSIGSAWGVLGALALGIASALAAAPPVNPVLDRLGGIDDPVMVRFQSQPLAQVFDAIGQAAGFTATVDPEIASRTITIAIGKTKLRAALLELATAQDLVYEVPDPKHLTVHPNPRAGAPPR